MIVAEVIPITSSILTESLSYLSSTDIYPGTVVSIPLRKREIRGIVISTSDVKDIKQSLRHQNFKMRNILEIHEETIFSTAYLKTIEQLRNYYLVNTGKLIDITYPKYITKNFDHFCYKKNDQKTEVSRKIQLLQKPYSKRMEMHVKTLSEKISVDQSIQIICPTVLDAKKIFNELDNSFDDNIYLLHGKTSKKKLSEVYKKTITAASIIISTPGYLDVPAKNKSLIILEHDSSSYYCRAVSPHIDLGIFVEQYTKNAGIELIIADGVLRPFRYDQIDAKNRLSSQDLFDSEKISFTQISNKKPLKQSDAERIADISKKVQFSPFSRSFKLNLEKSISNNEKIFCYVHRKSLAPTIVCRDCGNLAVDSDSNTPYQLFIKTNKNTGEKERIYVNAMNNKKISAFDLCQFCKSWRLQRLGIGTDNVREELKKMYPAIDIAVIDSLNTKNQTQINKEVKLFNQQSGNAKILIGTQLALPYLENIDSSFVLSLDSIFAQSSYTTEFRALSLIHKIYEATKGVLHVQSRNTLLEKLEKATKESYSSFIQSSLLEARDFDIHPFGTLIKISHSCAVSDYQKLYQIYSELFNSYTVDIRTRNNKKKGFIELVILIHVENKLWNIDTQNEDLYRKLPKEERNIHIEINPEVF